ncbi:hypothetical protein FQN57_007227 [Myotisia sp. PD_48]|nr:hypothetical protein FQN57_007227 [Myotisia sp. PD_48]
MAANVALTAAGYDVEFDPYREQLEKDSKMLWSLPWDDFINAWKTSPPAIPPGCPSLDEIDVSHEDVTVSDGEKVDVQIYRPKGGASVLPLVYVMHGGGWVVGSHGIEEAMNRSVCVKNQAPAYKFPIATTDSYDVLQWCRDNATRLSIDTTKIIIGGGSAGGNLAATLCLRLRDEGKLSGVLGQVLNIPVTCHYKLLDEAAKRFPDQKFDSYEENKDAYLVDREKMIWFWDKYTTKPESNPYASPLLASSHANLPPTLIQVAALDPLRDEGLAYGAALKAAGVPVTVNSYAGLPHGFYSIPTLTQTPRYHDAVVEFVTKLLENKSHL